MPIYAYRCGSCGHAQESLQKISDPVLTLCASCGAHALQKQVTAAGFQLKGTGWYVTDFRDGGRKSPADAAAPASSNEAGAAAATPAADASSSANPSGAPSASGPAAPATAPVPAASPAPTHKPSGTE